MQPKNSIFTKEFHDAVAQVCEKDYAETSKSLDEKFGPELESLIRHLKSKKTKQTYNDNKSTKY